MVDHKQRVNIYLPKELYQALITYQEQQGLEDASKAVVEILTQFLKPDEVKRYATVEELKALEGKVTYLSEQVAQLTQVIASFTPSKAAMQAPTESKEYTHPTKKTQQPSETVVSTSFEDVEDEPDEILYDFL